MEQVGSVGPKTVSDISNAPALKTLQGMGYTRTAAHQ
jgi:hypothetical protein